MRGSTERGAGSSEHPTSSVAPKCASELAARHLPVNGQSIAASAVDAEPRLQPRLPGGTSRMALAPLLPGTDRDSFRAPGSRGAACLEGRAVDSAAEPRVCSARINIQCG